MRKGFFRFLCALQILFLTACSVNEAPVDVSGTTSNDNTELVTVTTSQTTQATTADTADVTFGTTSEDLTVTVTVSETEEIHSSTEVTTAEAATSNVTTVAAAISNVTTVEETVPVTTAEEVPQWHTEDVSLDLYVNSDGISARKAPLQGYEKSRRFSLNDQVHVVARTDTNYYETDQGDFIHVDYLSSQPVTVVTTTAPIVTTAAAPASTTAPTDRPEYFDSGAWLPIKIDYDKYTYYGELHLPTNRGEFDDKERRPAYSKLLKEIPGYVSGEFEFTHVGKGHESMKFAHLTKENADKINELVNHYFDDLLRAGWFIDNGWNDSRMLSERRNRVFQLVDAKYCAMNSDVGDYAPDGTQYVGKTEDGYCYTAKTEVDHIYWIIAPRKFLPIPAGTYVRMYGWGQFEVSETLHDDFSDYGGRYVLAGSSGSSLYTLIVDSDYDTLKNIPGFSWVTGFMGDLMIA